MASLETINVLELTSACYDLAASAGEIIRAIFASGNLQTIDKDKQPRLSSVLARSMESISDPQTAADVQSQKLLVGSLKRRWPNLNIVGEEGDLKIEPEDTIEVRTTVFDSHAQRLPAEWKAVNINDVVVWIDPLDGTREYTLGILDAVTVLIGISVKGIAVAGVVHVPFASPPKTIWGITGLGAFGFEQPPAYDPNRNWVATSRSHLTEHLKQHLTVLAPNKVIYVGGAGHKSLLVLEGKADAYFFPQDGTKRWDTCAPDAVLHAAGGRMTDSRGNRIQYIKGSASYENSQGVIATLHNHEKYLLKGDNAVSAFAGQSTLTPPISKV